MMVSGSPLESITCLGIDFYFGNSGVCHIHFLLWDLNTVRKVFILLWYNLLQIVQVGMSFQVIILVIVVRIWVLMWECRLLLSLVN